VGGDGVARVVHTVGISSPAGQLLLVSIAHFVPVQ
jgi:hypothetical protein